MKNSHGLSMVEVLMALVVLGIVSAIFLQTSQFAQKNRGKSQDWTAEAIVIEKELENLRADSTVPKLQTTNYQRVDNSQGIPIRITTRGGRPSGAFATNFDPALLAQVTISAFRVGSSDSLEITTLIWTN